MDKLTNLEHLRRSAARSKELIGEVAQAAADAIREMEAAFHGGVPAGCILIWSGAADAVPEGWVVCDGTNNTPDLRDRFVLGGGGTRAVGAIGGAETHKLTVAEMPSHAYVQQVAVSPASTASNVVPWRRRITGTQSAVTDYAYATAGTASASTNARTDVSTQLRGSSAAHNNMPPYYVMCYIMKIG